MKKYISYFKLKVKNGLQYRAAALAGISTQIFFGFMYVSIYIAFYNTGSNGKLPMPLNQLVSYTWLVQAFLALVFLWKKDKELIQSIKNGDIAYEFLRPQDLYFMWLARFLGDRLSATLLRFLPVIIVAMIFPMPFTLKLSTNIVLTLLSIIAIILAGILASTLSLLFHIICLFTIDDRGIVNMFMVTSDVLSGLTIPIVFFPKYFQKISNILPFRYVTDFPIRLYVGNIQITSGLLGILIQIIWIILLILIGKFLLYKASKRIVVQGG